MRGLGRKAIKGIVLPSTRGGFFVFTTRRFTRYEK